MRSKWWQKLQKLGTRMKISVRTHSAHIWINAQPKSLETTLWLMKRESLDLHVLSVMGNSTKLHDLNKRWLNQERILHISAVNSSSLPQARSAHWLVKRGWSCSGAATRIICVFNDVISLVVNDAWWVSMMPCGVLTQKAFTANKWTALKCFYATVCHWFLFRLTIGYILL